MTDAELLDALSALLEAQFEALLLQARVPVQYVSPTTAPMATRAADVVRWARQAETQRARLEAALMKVRGEAHADDGADAQFRASAASAPATPNVRPSYGRSHQPSSAALPPQGPNSKRRARWPLAIILPTIVALLGWNLWERRSLRPAPHATASRTLKPARVTSSGAVRWLTADSGGSTLYYVSVGSVGASIVEQRLGSDIARDVVPATRAEYYGLSVSRDGRLLYATRSYGTPSESLNEVLQVDLATGVTTRIADDADSRAVSLIAGRVAFRRHSSARDVLATIDAAGRDEVVLGEFAAGETSGAGLAANPRGDTIAFWRASGDRSQWWIDSLTVAGVVRRVSREYWTEPGSLAWSPTDDVIYCTGSVPGAPARVWRVELVGGAREALTVDGELYDDIAVVKAAPLVLAATLGRNQTEIRVGAAHSKRGSLALEELDGLVGLTWLDEQTLIVSRADLGGTWGLWSVSLAGQKSERLTPRAPTGGSYGLPATVPGRREIVYTWTPQALGSGGTSRIMALDLDTRETRQLSAGPWDFGPSVSRDGAWVYYTKGQSDFAVARVSIEGGRERILYRNKARHVISQPDGSGIAFQRDDHAVYVADRVAGPPRIVPGVKVQPVKLGLWEVSSIRWVRGGRISYVQLADDPSAIRVVDRVGAVQNPIRVECLQGWVLWHSWSPSGLGLATVCNRSVVNAVLLSAQ